MPPQAAACLTVGLVLWLWRRDAKAMGSMPPSLWVPLVWVVINASRPVAYWFSTGTAAAAAADVTEGNFVDRTVYLILMGVGFSILARRLTDCRRVLRNGRWLIVLYAYFLISTTWSVLPFVAFKRWFKDTGDIVMILIMLTEDDPVLAIRAVFVRAAYLLVPVSVLFIKWYPALGRYTHRWTYETFYGGATTNKNSLGQLAMWSALLLLWQILDVKKARWRSLSPQGVLLDVVVLAMCLWLLSIAGSATSLVCCALGCLIMLGLRLNWILSRLGSLGWCGLGLLLIMLTFTVSTSFRALIAGVLGRDVTLTDRTLIWDAAIKSGSNPLIGCGFGSYWLTDYGDAVREEFHVEYSHNGYLETYLHTGAVGVLLVLLVLIAAGKNATGQVRGGSRFGHLLLSLFWAVVVFNYTEIAFGRSNVLGLWVALMVLYGPDVHDRSRAQKRKSSGNHKHYDGLP